MAWTSREVAERLAAQMSSYREQLGRRVVRYREAKGWNQEDLAYHSGVSNRTIQRLERGQHDGRVKTIQALARQLDVDGEIGTVSVAVLNNVDGARARVIVDCLP